MKVIGAAVRHARYILSRLNAASAAVNAGLEAYRFSEATTVAYAFWWDELCDRFITLSKPHTTPAPHAQPQPEAAAY